MGPLSSLRLFIALWPADAVRDAIVQWQAQWQWPERASIVRAERLHVTLHFLGDVPSFRVADLQYVLQRVPTPVFQMHFGRAEMWPHGTAVLRPDSPPTVLRALQARIGLALGEIALPVESRTFRPHVTLARRASAAVAPEQPAEIDWPAADGFVLVQTLPGGRGYEILDRFG
jgi:RNA 2',3'-cyclic 3'-phosphodiesterase